MWSPYAHSENAAKCRQCSRLVYALLKFGMRTRVTLRRTQVLNMQLDAELAAILWDKRN